ncbi:MAG TPA: chemotaxis protein CheW [Nitrospirota bacterium]
MTSSYLVFLLSGRLFGMKLMGAIEILPWRPSRPVPLAHRYVEGLIDYRGTVYPVFNLGQRLGINSPGPIGFTAEETTRTGGGRSIILLEENRRPFGVVVDAVVRMTKLEDPALGEVSGSLPDIDPGYLKGIVSENDQDILILDFERLLHVG